jgi:hypothetical protein
MDQATKIAGYANFEFGRRGSPGGGSGGIPGGHGTHGGVGWQLLYLAIGIASVLTLFGGAAWKALFKGIGSLLKRFALAVASLFTRRFWRQLSTWWASRPLGRWIFHNFSFPLRGPGMPRLWSWGNLPKGMRGGTNLLTGEVTIQAGLKGTQLFNTVIHEATHWFFIPRPGAFLGLARARAQQWFYKNSHFFKYVFEVLGKSMGDASLRIGLRHPLAAQGYNLTLGRVVTEGLAYALFVADMTLLGYLLSPYRE